MSLATRWAGHTNWRQESHSHQPVDHVPRRGCRGGVARGFVAAEARRRRASLAARLTARWITAPRRRCRACPARRTTPRTSSPATARHAGHLAISSSASARLAARATEALAAARRRDSTRRQRVLVALDRLTGAGEEISVAAVARAAGSTLVPLRPSSCGRDLEDPVWSRRLTDANRRALTPLFWSSQSRDHTSVGNRSFADTAR